MYPGSMLPPAPLVVVVASDVAMRTRLLSTALRLRTRLFAADLLLELLSVVGRNLAHHADASLLAVMHEGGAKAFKAVAMAAAAAGNDRMINHIEVCSVAAVWSGYACRCGR